MAVGDVAADVEAVILERRIIAVLVDARGDAGLDALAHRPVLPVDEIPEVDRVGRVEIGFAISSGWKRKRHSMRVRSAASGQSRKAAA